MRNRISHQVKSDTATISRQGITGQAANLQRAGSHAAINQAVPTIVHEVLRSPGQPLDTTTRAFMEPRFGYDFSRVRVHTNATAAASARALDAQAYTVGHDVVFAAGHYRPEHPSGRQLLAHELVHTMQQAQMSSAAAGTPVPFDRTPAGAVAEREADNLASAALTSGVRQPMTARPPAQAIQRQPGNTPRVQVRSPVFEETVTQLSDVAGATGGRPLSSDERALAHSIFANSIDYARVRLVPVDALQFRTIGNNIYIPHNFTIGDEQMAQTLIHELTHVWQYQHRGTSYISISLGTQIAATIRRGNRNFAYDYRITAGQSFFDFTPEQQGFMVENYFAMQRDQAMIPRNQATGVARTYFSNHLDSTGFNAPLSAADRLAEIARELPLHIPLIQQMSRALPQPEANLLQLRASEVMTSPLQDRIGTPPERQLTPVKPLLEIRF